MCSDIFCVHKNICSIFFWEKYWKIVLSRNYVINSFIFPRAVIVKKVISVYIKTYVRIFFCCEKNDIIENCCKLIIIKFPQDVAINKKMCAIKKIGPDKTQNYRQNQQSCNSKFLKMMPCLVASQWRKQFLTVTRRGLSCIDVSCVLGSHPCYCFRRN